MNPMQFRAVLDWYMCSDPWPDSDQNHQIITDWINQMSIDRGFAHWVEAYHDHGSE